MTFFENSQPFWIYSPWKRASKYLRPNEFSKQKYYFEFMTKMQKKNIFKWKYAETMDASSNYNINSVPKRSKET